MKIESHIKLESDRMNWCVHPSFFWVKNAYKVACNELSLLSANERRSVVVVASFPPIGPLLVGKKLADVWSTPLCIDYRDVWFGLGVTQVSRISPLNVLYLFNAYLRHCIEKSACAAVVVSEGQKTMHEAQSDLAATTIPNGVDFALLSGSRYQRSSKIFPITIRYFGRIFPPNRTPKPLLEALAAIPNKERKFHVEFYGTSPDQLLPLIHQWGCAHVCSIHPLLSHEKCLELQRSADMLLHLDWRDENSRGVISGKVYEYLVSGRPILLIGGSTQSDLAKLIWSAHAGYVLGDVPESIREFLRVLVHVPHEYLKPRSISNLVLQYDRKRLAGVYLRMLDQLAEQGSLSEVL